MNVQEDVRHHVERIVEFTKFLGELTQQNTERLALHPQHGMEVLARVQYLDDALCEVMMTLAERTEWLPPTSFADFLRQRGATEEDVQYALSH